jgi:hypothetical protein
VIPAISFPETGVAATMTRKVSNQPMDLMGFLFFGRWFDADRKAPGGSPGVEKNRLQMES